MSKFNVSDLVDKERVRLNSFVSEHNYIKNYRGENDDWLINNGLLSWAGVCNPEMLKLTHKGIRAVLDLAELRAIELEEKSHRKQGAAIATELFSGRIELNIAGHISYVDTMQEARESTNKAGIRLHEILR